jgi:hypothetical protein
MRWKREKVARVALAGAAALALIAAQGGFATASGPQDTEEATRDIVDTYLNSRPPAAKSAPKPKRRYRRRSGEARAARSGEVRPNQMLGVTVWRLRQATSNDTGERLLTYNASKKEEWTPERVEADTPLTPGDRVRLSIEVPRCGFIYIIDREQRADGSLGEPYLIFPQKQIGNGRNRVVAGQLLEIPDFDAVPNYMTIEPQSSDVVGEVLSVIVTDERQGWLTVEGGMKKLKDDEAARLEGSGIALIDRVELDGGIGTVWTKQERKAAGASGTPLSQGDPGPQTIYVVDTPPGGPTVVKIHLRYGGTKAAGT